MMSKPEKARSEISYMFDSAESKRNWPESYFPALNKAQIALAAWREKYPEAAQAEREKVEQAIADRLREQNQRAPGFDPAGC